MIIDLPRSLLKSKELSFSDKFVLAIIAEDCHHLPYFDAVNEEKAVIDNSIKTINMFQKRSLQDIASRIGAGLATIKRSIKHLQKLQLIEVIHGKRRLAPLFFKIKFDDNE